MIVLERGLGKADRLEPRVNKIYYQLTVAARIVGMPPARVRHYVNVGLVRAVSDDRGVPLLGVAELIRLRKIRRLTNDLGLNTAGVEIVLRLLDEIDSLRDKIQEAPDRNGGVIFGLLETNNVTQRRTD